MRQSCGCHLQQPNCDVHGSPAASYCVYTQAHVPHDATCHNPLQHQRITPCAAVTHSAALQVKFGCCGILAEAYVVKWTPKSTSSSTPMLQLKPVQNKKGCHWYQVRGTRV